MMSQLLADTLVADRTAARLRVAEVRRIRKRAGAGTARTAAPAARFRARRQPGAASRLGLRAS